MIYAAPETLVIISDTADPLYDPRAELPIRDSDVRNVARHGVIEPIVGRRRGDKVVVLDGRQRVRWAREVNRELRARGSELIKVPVVIRVTEDDGEFLELATSANEVRIDDSPLARARKAHRLAKLGRPLGAIALAFGVSKAAVQSWWRLLELAPEVQRAVAEERIRATDAVQTVGKLPIEKQAEAVRELEQARPTSKARGGARRGRPRPGGGRGMVWRLQALTKFLASNPEAVPRAFTTVLLWVLKEATDRELLTAFPALKPFVDEGVGGDRNERRSVLRRHRNGHAPAAGAPLTDA